MIPAHGRFNLQGVEGRRGKAGPDQGEIVRRGTTLRAAARMALSTLCLPLLAACVTTDDARVQQVLNQRGFGARYVGDTNEQYYLGIGDQFAVEDEQHPEFNELFRVRPDGVIDPKNLDEIFVAGLTMADVQETLTRRYREFNTTAQINATLIASVSKWYYIDGEVGAAGRKPFEGDTTLFRAVFDSAPTLLSDDDAVQLIRADPYHPLVVEFDYDDMLEGGWSLANAEVRENDIIFVPPNVWGYLTNIAVQLFSPIAVVSQAVFGVNSVIYSIDTFGDTNRFGNRNNRNNFSRMSLPSSREDMTLMLAPVDPAVLGAQ